MLIEEIRHILKNKDSKEFRKFGLTIGIFLLLVGLFLFVKSNDNYKYLVGIGGCFAILGLIIPIVLRPFYIIWMSFASVLGFIMTRVILGTIFYLIFTPVGIAMRISGKKLLDEKIDKSAQSYWIKREKKEYLPIDSEKQY